MSGKGCAPEGCAEGCGCAIRASPGPLGSRESAEWRFRGLLSGELLLMKERLAESFVSYEQNPQNKKRR